MRPCLEPRCPNLTNATRCRTHQQQHDARRNASPDRDKYRGDWARTSRQARAASPLCALCGATDDLTLDHTTWLVVCRRCHRPEAHGGVRRRS
jgi:hypothetical protein